MTSRLFPRALLCGLSLVISACGDEPRSAEWAIPVSQDTPIIEHPAVSIDEREGQRVELVRDLVIGARGDDPDYLFFFEEGWKALAVDDEGRIYVGDGPNRRIQVFDPRGRYLRTLGRPGSGPGELEYPPFLITVAGERVLVGYSRRPRLDEWSSAGEFLNRRHFDDDRGFLQLSGTESGDFLAAYGLRVADDSWRREVHIARLADVASLELQHMRQVDPPMAEAPSEQVSVARPLMKLGFYRPSFDVARSGELYLTGGSEYQVLAQGADGHSRWRMRVPWPRHRPTEAEQAKFLEQFRQAGAAAANKEWFEARTRDDVGVVGPWPALSSIRVDGHGHIYVFPTVTELPGTYDELPVDVYSSDGERLFAGFLPVLSPPIDSLSLLLYLPLLSEQEAWLAAFEDYVYRIEEDERTGEGIVVRYRLVEPFD